MWKSTGPLYKSAWYTLLSLLHFFIFSTYARSVKREGHNLTEKENTQISRLLRLLHSSAVMLVNSAVLQYCGYRDSPTQEWSYGWPPTHNCCFGLFILDNNCIYLEERLYDHIKKTSQTCTPTLAQQQVLVKRARKQSQWGGSFSRSSLYCSQRRWSQTICQ